MIYLATVVGPLFIVTLPLLALACIKRVRKEPKPEHTLLPYSVAATSAEKLIADAHLEAAKAATPPPPPQPSSDGAGTGTCKKDAETSKKDATTTKKVTSSGGDQTTDRKSRSRERVMPADQYNAFVERRNRSCRKRSPQQAYLNPQSYKHSSDRYRGGARTPNGRQLPSKKSKKSRKAGPRSPSFKEFQARNGARTPAAKTSRTDLDTLLASASNKQDTNKFVKSAQSAVSEYVAVEAKQVTLGKVDEMIANCDEEGLLYKHLATHQELTALSPTNHARSPFFDGEISIWIADRAGSDGD